MAAKKTQLTELTDMALLATTTAAYVWNEAAQGLVKIGLREPSIFTEHLSSAGCIGGFTSLALHYAQEQNRYLTATIPTIANTAFEFLDAYMLQHSVDTQDMIWGAAGGLGVILANYLSTKIKTRSAILESDEEAT